ncbi:MAG: PorT family protein [Bacteroidia bacterium]|nr:PorT family protein [Bacteroidia bacterium]MDW8088343.1 porin family protein [Bacteroidia bacterium]
MRTLKNLSVFLGLSGLIWAQANTFKIGLVGAPQTTWLLNQEDMDAGPILDYKTTWGFMGGLSLAYHFSNYVGVGLDLLYSSEGQRYTGKDEALGLRWEGRTRLNYLKIPLLLRLGSDPESPVQLSFSLGPQLGLLLSAEDKMTVKLGSSELSLSTGNKEGILYEVTPINPERVSLNKPAYASTTFGATVGLGVAIRLTESLHLSFQLRGDYTFTDIENKKAEYAHGTHTHSYWEQDIKYRSASHGGGGGQNEPESERSPTAALTGGFVIGLTYLIPLQ